MTVSLDAIISGFESTKLIIQLSPYVTCGSHYDVETLTQMSKPSLIIGKYVYWIKG